MRYFYSARFKDNSLRYFIGDRLTFEGNEVDKEFYFSEYNKIEWQ